MSTPRGTAGRRDAVIAGALLALGLTAFVVVSSVLVPRLTNVSFGDVEFTGWSGPLASRLAAGERPYVDFVLPIPPGSFVVLALLEKLVGRPLLLTELALNAALQGVMGLLAYHMARSVTSRRNAVLTALATLVVVMELKKECAYDSTAQVVAWASVACGLRGLVLDDSARTSRWLVGAGFFAGFTILFKQSTGVGCVAGYLIAFLYLFLADVRQRATHARGFLSFARGLGFGLFATWLVLLLLGSTARAFFQAAFLDASVLKGGTHFLVRHLLVYLFDGAAYPGSLVAIAGFVAVGTRLVRHGENLHLGDERERAESFSPWEPWAIALLLGTATVSAVYFVSHRPHGYPPQWIGPLDALKNAAPLALVATCAVFVTHLLEPDDGSDRVRRGHALDAALLVAFSASLLHNTSAPEFRPYYDNNALIPLTLTFAFVALDRAALRPLAFLFLTAIFASAAGEKYFRAMTATMRVDGGYWDGLRVSPHGVGIAKAALAVRGIAGPNDTVLVLPEDLQIERLIERPRPPLLGAVVFVDQYAPRLVEDDIARLAENPPKVIVVHPSDEAIWQDFFRIWSGTSGAEKLVLYVLRVLLPARYDRVASFPANFHLDPTMLDVYVRRDGPPPEGGEGARW